MLKSLMKSGMAGNTIVSANMATKPKQLRITSVFQEEWLIFSFSVIESALSLSHAKSLKHQVFPKSQSYLKNPEINF